jgi:hypothetical protein
MLLAVRVASRALPPLFAFIRLLQHTGRERIQPRRSRTHHLRGIPLHGIGAGRATDHNFRQSLFGQESPSHVSEV